MTDIFITSAAIVGDADVRSAKLGTRFGRLDLMSQLALLAVESLGIGFNLLPRDRVAICLAARAGSLSTDVEFWQGRNDIGGPSPTLFAYTLPSAAIGEIAIRNRLTGPNLCFVGTGDIALRESAHLLRRGEADACVCVACSVLTPAAAAIIQAPAAGRTCALFLRPGNEGFYRLREIDRDMESLCAIVCAQKSAGQ